MIDPALALPPKNISRSESNKFYQYWQTYTQRPVVQTDTFPKRKKGQPLATYDPMRDYIWINREAQFHWSSFVYVLGHEILHSTGHSTRLARPIFHSGDVN